MRLYAYCLSDQATRSTIEGIRGIAGAELELIGVGGISVVASPHEAGHVSLTRANVFAHERVTQHILKQTTPLPFRFGALTSEARLTEYVKTNHDRLLGLLGRVRDCVEMSVKIISPAKAGQDAAGPVAPRSGRGSAAPQGPGQAFLAAKRLEIKQGEQLQALGAGLAAWLKAGLGNVARESNLRVCPTRALILAAAFIVERGRLEDYHARLESLRGGRSDLHFLTSGPWPPYSITVLDQKGEAGVI